jgi:hypothetical protein
MSYGRSKCVIRWNQCDHSKIGEKRRGNISISSKKIATIFPGDYLQHHVADIQRERF